MNGQELHTEFLCHLSGTRSFFLQIFVVQLSRKWKKILSIPQEFFLYLLYREKNMDFPMPRIVKSKYFSQYQQKKCNPFLTNKSPYLSLTLLLASQKHMLVETRELFVLSTNRIKATVMVQQKGCEIEMLFFGLRQSIGRSRENKELLTCFYHHVKKNNSRVPPVLLG